MGFFKKLFAAMLVKPKVERLSEQSSILVSQTVDAYTKALQHSLNVSGSMIKCVTTVTKNHSAEIAEAVTILAPVLKDLKASFKEVMDQVQPFEEVLKDNETEFMATIDEIKNILDIAKTTEEQEPATEEPKTNWNGIPFGSSKEQVLELLNLECYDRVNSHSYPDRVREYCYINDGDRSTVFKFENSHLVEVEENN